ncbi:hypothetical protein D7Y15_13365 [Corallococcus sp. AB030]|uniref:hypothetical protein n=1 Tax=Corallococcus sp. AB030 TaxID=2316716 RepID=UPI000ED7688C|nr:hypothetical protein [Corallococcus sp. AB030]RKI15665.1 hypothetical protein D7Y15_13365 [Corallococcus sp. AB030]
MRSFQDMGRLLQERWLKVQHSEEAFPDIAAEVLRELAPHQAFKTLEPLEWLYGTRDFPKQLTTRPGFGQPALTVFSDARLLIDLYYWVDGTTDIHQHGFCGAFQVLQGSSIHGHYHSRGHAEVMDRLKETFDAEEVDGQSDDIAALAASLRESTLFRPLFRG